MPAIDFIAPRLRFGLEAQLISTAAKGFKRDETPEFCLDVREHLRQGKLYIAVVEGKAEGFAVMQDFRELGATYIAGIVKNGGAPKRIIEEIVSRHVADFQIVTVRTQNDRVVEIMKDVCPGGVIPLQREGGEREREILQQIGLLGTNVGDDLVARRHYGNGPMIGGERRRSDDMAVRGVTARLNYFLGDALLLVGYK